MILTPNLNIECFTHRDDVYGLLLDHETIPGGVKRITLTQLDKAVEQAMPEVKDQEEAIYDTRVSLKKLRTLLRLARAKHNDDVFAHENAYYRDVGRRLSEVRDTTTMASPCRAKD